MSLGYERPYWADEDWADVPPNEAPDKQMTIEEKFRDYDARIKAGGINAEPCHYFKAGYLFGAHAVKASVVPVLAQDGERISVEETLEIVGSYGPYGNDINESLRMQIVLADEVKRLRGLIESISALTGPEVEPVGYIDERGNFWSLERHAIEVENRRLHSFRPLYTHPADDGLRKAAEDKQGKLIDALKENAEIKFELEQFIWWFDEEGNLEDLPDRIDNLRAELEKKS